ncbi:MAG: regulatory protein RecX [Acetobacteraceae bacterium]
MPGKAPNARLLHEAALAHLARYPGTKSRLLQVLLRRIARWARSAQAEPEVIAAQVAEARVAARAVVEQLALSGVVDDASFAAARARRLARSGTSRRGIAAHLVRHGLQAKDLGEILGDDPEAELAAALEFARKRHIGPFGADCAADAAGRKCQLAQFARAGYPAAIARAALSMKRTEAEDRLEAARSGRKNFIAHHEEL